MNKPSWLDRLKTGLSKSTVKLTDGIAGIFTKRKLDDEALEELEEVLITADLGPATAANGPRACDGPERPPRHAFWTAWSAQPPRFWSSETAPAAPNISHPSGRTAP